MANTINNLRVIDLDQPGINPVNAPTYVAARLLAQDTAESITVPANAAYVRIAATADIFVAYNFTGGAAATAVNPVDTDDGTSNELIKLNGGDVWRDCKNITSLSVLTHASAATVTASFYGL